MGKVVWLLLILMAVAIVLFIGCFDANTHGQYFVWCLVTFCYCVRAPANAKLK